MYKTLNPITLSLFGALLYGLGGPFNKLALQAGATSNGIITMYWASALTFAFYFKQTNFFGTSTGFWWSAATGMCFGLGLVLVNKALSMPTGYVSIVTVIVAGFPVISTFIALMWMGEASNTNVSRLLAGTALVLIGVYLVSTSTKSSS